MSHNSIGGTRFESRFKDSISASVAVDFVFLNIGIFTLPTGTVDTFTRSVCGPA